MSAAASRACPVCGAPMAGPHARFRFDCRGCGFAQADLPVVISLRSDALREDARAVALAPLRQRNFDTVLDRLAAHGMQPGGTLLEVGCAHGWFLDAAARRGHAVQGIEPDDAIAAQAAARGHAVLRGFFPGALPQGARFDAIVFNDVFEHLSDPRAAIDAARDALRPRGLLAINLPSSDGAFYRIADALRKVGWRGPHDRMWQVGFPSPHLSYFHPDALARLAAQASLRELERRPLPSVAREGLWQRLRYDARASWPASAATFAAVTAAWPLLGRLPPDIVLQVFAAAPPGQRAASGGTTTATR